MEISTTSVSFSEYRPGAVLKITGEDAFSFLQGQFTQDLRPCLEGETVAYGLWLNHKGKVQADSFVLRRGETWWVFSYFSAGVALKERLEAFIIADDVTIEEVTTQWNGVSLLGVDRAEVVAWTKGRAEDFVFPGRRGAGNSTEWLYPVSGDSAAKELRARGIVEIGSGELERLRIEAAMPAVPRDVGPEDLPNEAGLDNVAVSYTKGCYLGQEVMARLKSMGQVRRRLVRVEGEGAAPGGLPVVVFCDGKKCGELRSAIETRVGFSGLAMISLLGMTGRRLLSFSPEGAANIVVSHEG